MSYVRLFFILLATRSVLSDDCFVYNFETDFDQLFNNNRAICTSMPSTWELGYYEDLTVAAPHYKSEKFIKPGVSTSCVSSESFPVESSGVIEVKIYMESTSLLDQVTVLVNRVVSGGNDAAVASAFISAMSPDFENGWHILRLTLLSTGTYDGYVSFLGYSDEDSIILIDSFRYLSPAASDGQCNYYEEDAIPTTNTPTTTSSPVDQGCLTYDFEADFSSLFTTNNDLCAGFSQWHLANYSSSGIDTANPKTDLFMTPAEYTSCIASFPFALTPKGTIEVNIYLEPKTALDHIIVLVKKLVSSGTDTVAGLKIYEPSITSFKAGWNILQIPVTDFWTFNGYLIFLGAASEGSTVLVDSFRYIPPNYSPDDESCAIY